MSDDLTITVKHEATKDSVASSLGVKTKSLLKAQEKELKERSSKEKALAKEESNLLKAQEKEIKEKKKAEEKLVKFQFAESKKLIAKGYDVNVAGLIAIKRSMMSEEQIRNLRLKELAEDVKNKKGKGKDSEQNRLLRDIAKQTKLSRLALGNVIGKGISKVAGSIYGAIKEGLKKDVKRQQGNSLLSVIYPNLEDKGSKKGLRSQLFGGLSGTSYIDPDQQNEILQQGASLKGVLHALGREDLLFDQLSKITRLVSAKMDVSQAVELIKSSAQGEFQALGDEARLYDASAISALDIQALSQNPSVDTRFQEQNRLVNTIPTNQIRNKMNDNTELLNASNAIRAEEEIIKIVKDSLSILSPLITPLIKGISNLLASDFIKNPGKAIADSIANAGKAISNSISTALADWFKWGKRSEEKKSTDEVPSS